MIYRMDETAKQYSSTRVQHLLSWCLSPLVLFFFFPFISQGPLFALPPLPLEIYVKPLALVPSAAMPAVRVVALPAGGTDPLLLDGLCPRVLRVGGVGGGVGGLDYEWIEHKCMHQARAHTHTYIQPTYLLAVVKALDVVVAKVHALLEMVRRCLGLGLHRWVGWVGCDGGGWLKAHKDVRTKHFSKADQMG